MLLPSTPPWLSAVPLKAAIHFIVIIVVVAKSLAGRALEGLIAQQTNVGADESPPKTRSP